MLVRTRTYIYTEEDIFTLINLDEDQTVGSRRDAWLKKIEEGELVFQSARVETFIQLYSWLRYKFPNESMVVFSIYLRFLDIISVALRKRYGIEALRYDGTMNQV